MTTKILIVLGAGGHTEQMLKIVRDLGNEQYKFEYITSNDDKVSKNRIKTPGKLYYILNPRKMTDKSLIIGILKFIPSFIQSFGVIFKARPKCIISCGPGVALPVIIAGKILGKKVIFLESWSRVYNKSLSGKIAYHFSDLFFVQWEELKQKYPKAIYAGRLG